MAVVCPGCGREYDVTLFSHGRTIHCTCGSRVGLDERRRTVAGGRFLVDAMLGRLARWMRIAGLDAAYAADLDDEDLVRRALAEHRLILTRDRRLPHEWTAPPIYVVDAEATLAQLAEVVARFDLADSVRPFSRCSLCNEPLVAAPDSAVRARVPERMRDAPQDFRMCPACGRVYWRGSHTGRMEATLEHVLTVVRRGRRRYRHSTEGGPPASGGSGYPDPTHDTGEDTR